MVIIAKVFIHWACDYLSMLGLKLNHVSKRGHWARFVLKTKAILRDVIAATGLVIHNIPKCMK